MIKKSIKQMLLTGCVILVPIVVGLLLWNRLPEQLPGHWDIHGNVDGWYSKPVVVFFFPLLFLALQWTVTAALNRDASRNDQPKQITRLIPWLFPILSLATSSLSYWTALGHSPKADLVLPLLLGVMLLVVGNHMPKIRQNRFLGIRLPTTLADEENWDKTHRFAGKVWIVCGLITLVASFLGGLWGILPVLAAAIIPIVYSFLFHLKKRRNEH